VVLTDGLSIAPAVGLASRPSSSRVLMTSRASYGSVSADLGITPTRLKTWYLEQTAAGSEAAEELSRLRREVKRLSEENEIWQKASAFFASKAGKTNLAFQHNPPPQIGGKETCLFGDLSQNRCCAAPNKPAPSTLKTPLFGAILRSDRGAIR